ncbi:hypothetical protein [Streptomyces filamentosus]|uniref:hypothetical protein n=1 Tax=Streptomyces filamentosus TaxID=67294 RepID=UPI0034014D3B
MTPSTLLALWVVNWLVVSLVAAAFVRGRPAGSRGPRPDLWGLEDNAPGLTALLLLAWPVALFRLAPAVVPSLSRRP